MFEDTDRIVTFIGLSLLIASVPGPTSLYIVAQSLSDNWKNPISAIVGMTLANITWISLCAIGVGAVLQESYVGMEIIRGVGVIYLIYLGILLIKSAGYPLQKVKTNPNDSLTVVLINAYFTSLSNPKAMLFYLSFLPQFLTGYYAYHIEFIIWGTFYIALATLVMIVYVIIAYKANILYLNNNKRKYLSIALGIAVIGSAISLWNNKSTLSG